MKGIKLDYVSAIFICLSLFISCGSDVDFNQTENILAKPIVESSLIFSSLEAPDFIDDTTQQERLILTDTTRLEYINSDFFVNQILKTELTFLFSNSLNRAFNVDFVFVNDAHEQRYIAQVEVLAGQPESPAFIASNFLIEEPDLSLFEEATTLIYRITLPSATNPIEPLDLGELKLESKSTFYFEL